MCAGTRHMPGTRSKNTMGQMYSSDEHSTILACTCFRSLRWLVGPIQAVPCGPRFVRGFVFGGPPNREPTEASAPNFAGALPIVLRQQGRPRQWALQAHGGG